MGREAFLVMARDAGTIIATRDEAEVLTGSPRPRRRGAPAAAGPRRGRPEARADEGAVWAGADGGSARVPAATPPGPVLDSTGAGDAFAAAWLAARREGRGPRAALEAACALAARVVARPGARP